MLAEMGVRCVGRDGGEMCWQRWGQRWGEMLAETGVRCVGTDGGEMCWQRRG